MYSFVLARRADESDSSCARPAVSLDDLINPASAQAARGAKKPLPIEQVGRALE
jgi:hypothetical protein